MGVVNREDWWIYCIALFILLTITEAIIAYLYPSIDAAFTFWIFRTHHIFELLGLFFLGLGMARFFHIDGRISINVGQILMWAVFLGTLLIEIILKPFNPVIIMGAVSIIVIPLWTGFYGYLIIQSLRGISLRAQETE